MPTPPPTAPRRLEPARNCALCPRLAAFRAANAAAFPDWHNAPVPSFGPLDAPLLVVGLAPGLRGANATGRPFTGDYAGLLLYPTLLKFGFATGRYGGRRDDGLALAGARITNAVRCVPPRNKPTAEETATCHDFLAAEIVAMRKLRCVVTLGNIAHGAVVRALGLRRRDAPFGHGRNHGLPGGLRVIASYHCSRLNTNTGRLTVPMFEDVIRAARAAVDG